MAHYGSFEGLSAELLDAIVSDLSTRDRASLSQASRRLHGHVAPTIYDSWSYNGHIDSSKSLYCFLRTMILHPWLARHVKALDIGNWGDCYRRPGQEYRRTFNTGKRQKAKRDNADEAHHESAACEDDFEILRRGVRDLNLDDKTAARYERGTRDRDENFLLALIISRLPNLQTLYLFVPKSWKPVHSMLLHGSRNGSNICRKLHNIYIGQATPIGTRGHQQYFLEFVDTVLPLSQIPSLRCLQSLTSDIVDSYDHQHKFKAYPAKSMNLTELVLDESPMGSVYLLKLVTLPKALKRFRWGQVEDYSTGTGRPSSCLQRALVEALEAQKDSLESLDLNGLPPDPNDRTRFRNEHLVGSLKGFAVLKILSIPALALCGDTTWGLAPHPIVEVLPSSLETLNLRVNVVVAGPEQNAEGIWMDRMVELALEAKNQLPALRKVSLAVSNDWRPTREDNKPFKRLGDACVRSGIGFEVRKATMFGISPDPYFQRIRVERFR